MDFSWPLCYLAPNSSSVSSLLYEKKIHSDVTFLVGSEKVSVKAHKLILAAKSDVMERMLYGNWTESRQSEVSLPKTDPTAFEALLEYIYTGRVVEFDVSCLPILVKVCDYFDVKSLQKECLKWLYDNVDCTNVCKYLGLSERFDGSLHAKCQSILTAETDRVLESDAFATDTEPQYVRSLVQNDAIKTTEFQLFSGLLRWGKNEQPDRDIKEFLPHIRFRLMTLDELERVRKSGAVEKETIDQVTAAFSFDQQQPFTDLVISTRPRSPLHLGFDDNYAVGFDLKERKPFPPSDEIKNSGPKCLPSLKEVQQAVTLDHPTPSIQVSNITLARFLYLHNLSIIISSPSLSKNPGTKIAIGLVKPGSESAENTMKIVFDAESFWISYGSQRKKRGKNLQTLIIVLSAIHERIAVRIFQGTQKWTINETSHFASFEVPSGNLRQSREHLQVIIYNSHSGIKVSLGVA